MKQTASLTQTILHIKRPKSRDGFYVAIRDFKLQNNKDIWNNTNICCASCVSLNIHKGLLRKLKINHDIVQYHCIA